MRTSVALLVALLSVSIALLVGCGGDDEHVGERVDGAGVFASAGCANCHTLSAANATGVVGPDLDHRRPSAVQVRVQVNRGGGGMPSFRGKLSPEQIRAVARYVERATRASEPRGPAR